MSEKCTCEHPVRDCIEAENCVGVQRFSKPRNELAALKRQRYMLLDALNRYGRHQVMGEMCAVLAHGDNPCTCGLDAAIAAVEVGE